MTTAAKTTPHEDLVAALSAMTEIPHDKEAKVKTQSGRDYSYTYTDLASIMQYVRPILTTHHMVVSQPVSSDNGDVIVATKLMHASGEVFELGEVAMPRGSTPQATGSSITYARRYGLLSGLGLATEDDDANLPSRGESNTEVKPRRKARVTEPAPVSDAEPAHVRAAKTSIWNRAGNPTGDEAARPWLDAKKEAGFEKVADARLGQQQVKDIIAAYDQLAAPFTEEGA